jgi:hypothetical protein
MNEERADHQSLIASSRVVDWVTDAGRAAQVTAGISSRTYVSVSQHSGAFWSCQRDVEQGGSDGVRKRRNEEGNKVERKK